MKLPPARIHLRLMHTLKLPSPYCPISFFTRNDEGGAGGEGEGGEWLVSGEEGVDVEECRLAHSGV
jgi:hypothetical protein